MSNRRFSLAVLFTLFATGQAEAALTFNFNAAAGTPQNVIDGFAAAGQRWSALFTDSVTVNVNIAFPSLGPGILGSTSSTRGTIGYTSYKAALTADRKSADDVTAAASLQSGSTFDMLLNYTNNNPNGVGSATAYLDNDGDANNSTIRLTLSNARALGLFPAVDGTLDASISFSSNFAWDFDPSNGIDTSAFDFIGVATHEIGHALGFVSGVDTLDTNSTSPNFFNDNVFNFVSPLDLYRFSASSTGVGSGVIDWTAGLNGVDRYFSIDGGATKIASFSTGQVHGDGRQASHWKDNLGIGILDPTAASGEFLALTVNDFRAMDVIGWDPVPEPASVVLLASAVLLAALRRRSS